MIKQKRPAAGQSVQAAGYSETTLNKPLPPSGQAERLRTYRLDRWLVVIPVWGRRDG